MDENALITAACGGDLEAFNSLVLKYQDQVYNHALWILKEPEAAEDLAQEAFILAFRNLRQYHSGFFRAWLLRIVTNACYDELRRRKRQPGHNLFPLDAESDELDSPSWMEDPGLSVEETIEHNEFRAGLQRCLDELSEDYRTILWLIDVMEMDYAEVAVYLNIPMGTVKSRLARARLRLRARLERAPDLYMALPGIAVRLERSITR